MTGTDHDPGPDPDQEPAVTDVGPLHGLRVVELAGGLPAAFCARQLRGFGAETVRVEIAVGVPTVVDHLTDDQRLFCVAGAHRVVVGDAHALVDLLAEADVIIEDQGPGVLAAIGYDPEANLRLRPHQVITSLSPFGHSGPRAEWHATNAVQFAVGGLMSLTGDPDREPLVTGGEQALALGGLHGFAATAVAVLGRARHGRGAWLDLSLQEIAASMPELYGAQSEYDLRQPVPRSGNSVRAVWGVYHCADGFAGVCCLERQVRAFFELLGEPVMSDPRFADPATRADHDDELLAHVLSFMAERTKDELAALSPVHRVPFGAVRTPSELLDDETFALRGFFDRVTAEDGEAVVPGRPFPGPTWTSSDRLHEPTHGHVVWEAPGWGPFDDPGVAAGDDDPQPGPLAGVRVLDLTMMWAGPYATKLLAEAGADVVKIESPSAWDNIRTLVAQDPAIPDPWNSSYYFNEYNHSKRSLTLDLACDAGRQVFLGLVASADVVIENYRADVLDNLGLGFEVLQEANDRIVAVSMAGFGKTGPLADHVGFGPIIEMMSGLMSLTGYGDDGIPYKTGVSYGDPVGGVNAVAAVALALLDRDRTGRGRHIDLAQRETAATMGGPAFVAASLRGEKPTHLGNRDPRYVPQGCYPAAGNDQWVVISVRSDDEWAALAHRVGRPDLAHRDQEHRWIHHDELDEAIAAWTVTVDADEVAEILQGDGVPAGAVVDTLAVHDDPQLMDREFYRVVPNPKMRPYRQTGPTWRVHGPRPHQMRRSPWFGEDNEAILAELGLSAERIDELRSARVIADAPIDPGVG